MVEKGGGPVERKLFTYARYNVELDRDGLDGLGLHHVDPDAVRKLDSIEHVAELQAIGRRLGETRVQAFHFAGFPP
jgi:hypothetical protein